MKVKDLIVELEKCNPEDTVSVPVTLAYATLGGQPCREVRCVTSGFDWDKGQVFLDLDVEQYLTPLTKQEYLELVEYKRLVMYIRGRGDLESLSDIFITKAKARNVLHQAVASTNMNKNCFNALMNFIDEAKLEDKL